MTVLEEKKRINADADCEPVKGCSKRCIQDSFHSKQTLSCIQAIGVPKWFVIFRKKIAI